MADDGVVITRDDEPLLEPERLYQEPDGGGGIAYRSEPARQWGWYPCLAGWHRPSGGNSIRSVAMVTEGAREFLKDGPLGHLVTLNPDGTPHVTLVWAGFEEDGLVFASFFDQHKLDCLRRDPHGSPFHSKRTSTTVRGYIPTSWFVGTLASPRVEHWR